jgi:hypothetical protein
VQQIVGHGLELLDGSLYLGQCPPVMGLHIGFCSYGRAEHYNPVSDEVENLVSSASALTYHFFVGVSHFVVIIFDLCEYWNIYIYIALIGVKPKCEVVLDGACKHVEGLECRPEFAGEGYIFDVRPDLNALMRSHDLRQSLGDVRSGVTGEGPAARGWEGQGHDSISFQTHERSEGPALTQACNGQKSDDKLLLISFETYS